MRDDVELKRTPLEAEIWTVTVDGSTVRIERQTEHGYDVVEGSTPAVVTGAGAMGMLQRVVTNDLTRASVGEALYNLVLNDGGGVVEDLIVYRLEEDRFFVVPNAANAQPICTLVRPSSR